MRNLNALKSTGCEIHNIIKNNQNEACVMFPECDKSSSEVPLL